MSQPKSTDQLLVEGIRAGESDAWSQLIARYEGRLLAFSESRLGRRAASEDVVQETFIGFLTSLPNFDARRSLESYLFSICAHKLTDYLRREGRRVALPFSTVQRSERTSLHVAAAERAPSAIVRSLERKQIEDEALGEAIRDFIHRWQERGDWTKLMCLELIFVRGRGNKDVAQRLGLTEQQVANYKSDFLIQLRKTIRKQGLPAEIFPELHPASSKV